MMLSLAIECTHLKGILIDCLLDNTTTLRIHSDQERDDERRIMSLMFEQTLTHDHGNYRAPSESIFLLLFMGKKMLLSFAEGKHQLKTKHKKKTL